MDSIAKGTTPEYVGAEPGSEHLLHLVGREVSTTEGESSPCRKKRSKFDAARKDFKTRHDKVDVLLDEFTDYFRKKRAVATDTSDLLQHICEAQKRKQIAEESAAWMSPARTRIFMRAATKEVQVLQTKLIDRERQKEA